MSNEKADELYEDVYFDSDEETEGIGFPGRIKSNRKVLSDDELLYDPALDEKDEAWVIKQVEADCSREKTTEGKTDAILTCPMCFITLSYSCQRHERYAQQYRAMFVHHCHVIETERYQPKGAEKDEHYQKVVCDQCGVHVAMMDQDEVYHFFNVVPTA
ncbi:E2F-associated phosphoprotein-domain-containing protein [Sporodiniella umbellata]|nr:E2F-associated phosphoprotein-domain-containing protein [Sporodiniella umbellata]